MQPSLSVPSALLNKLQTELPPNEEDEDNLISDEEANSKIATRLELYKTVPKPTLLQITEESIYTAENVL